MRGFYEAFYTAVEHSEAHRAFCERVFGKDLGQHGFADLEQLELLIEVAGLDYIPLAVEQARRRTTAKSDRLAFEVGDINALELPPGAFDLVLSIDSMYFSDDYSATIRALKATLRPGGRMAIFFSYGREPWVAIEEFPAEKLPPEKTPLAEALEANSLVFRSWDLTANDYELALRRQQVLAELRPRFEAEGNLFIHENRSGDAEGISQALEAGLHARYLYLAASVSHAVATRPISSRRS